MSHPESQPATTDLVFGFTLPFYLAGASHPMLHPAPAPVMPPPPSVPPLGMPPAQPRAPAMEGNGASTSDNPRRQAHRSRA
jgi:hypothetical protein